MPTVRGCNLPDDLLYDVDNHIWFTEMGDGNVKIGSYTFEPFFNIVTRRAFSNVIQENIKIIGTS